MTEKLDASKLDIHTEEQFRAVLMRAGRTIACSWFVGAVRHKSDGRWVPILMFADDDNQSFAYAFELRNGEAEILALCTRLKDVQRKCDEGNLR